MKHSLNCLRFLNCKKRNSTSDLVLYKGGYVFCPECPAKESKKISVSLKCGVRFHRRNAVDVNPFLLSSLRNSGSATWLRIPAHREHPFRSIVSSDSGRT